MITKLRPYRVEDVIESSFLKSDTKRNQDWCEEDLKRSGLEPDDILASAPESLKLPSFAQAGYHIPYFDLEGRVITRAGTPYNTMWRVRYKTAQFTKDPRYLQPSREKLQLEGLPSFLPYLLPYPKEYDDGTIYCVEGEKKTGSVIKHCRVAAFGINGCQMWRNPDGTGGLHPWISQYLTARGVKRVRIIPDADVLRYDMCQTYGTYAITLQRAGYEVELLHPSDKIDDLIVRHLASGELPRDFLESIPRLDPNGFVQSSTSLAAEYNLAFRRDNKGNPVTYQHTANVMKLMEEHDAFPTIWRNLDTNRVMVGEEIAKPDLTEMDIANHFQFNFGFDKITSRIIYTCIQALSKRNEKSPFLDYIRSLQWDRTKRLSSWLTTFWGVESSDYIQEIATKWLVSACARMDKPGSKVDWIFIVVGPQGTGKTSMPGIVFKGNSLTLYGDQNDKDLHMLLHSSLVIGFDELDSFGKRESSNLKAMITRQEDAFRPPYGASIEVFPRRFTLYGCGNHHEFLQHDPSGYRRYAIVEVNRLLDFSGLQSNVDQLWAEAWWRYQHDDLNWWEINNASEYAKDFVIPNTIEEMITNWIHMQVTAKHANMVKDGILRFTMSQLMNGIEESGSSKNPSVTKEIAAILRSLGCEYKSVKINGSPVKAYIYKIPE